HDGRELLQFQEELRSVRSGSREKLDKLPRLVRVLRVFRNRKAAPVDPVDARLGPREGGDVPDKLERLGKGGNPPVPDDLHGCDAVWKRTWPVGRVAARGYHVALVDHVPEKVDALDYSRRSARRPGRTANIVVEPVAGEA